MGHMWLYDYKSIVIVWFNESRLYWKRAKEANKEKHYSDSRLMLVMSWPPLIEKYFRAKNAFWNAYPSKITTEQYTVAMLQSKITKHSEVFFFLLLQMLYFILAVWELLGRIVVFGAKVTLLSCTPVYQNRKTLGS